MVVGLEGPHEIIPPWLRSHISREDLLVVTKAIHTAEAPTDGEIVPVIVHRSVSSSHIGTVCVLALWLVAIASALAVGLHNEWVQLASLLGFLTVFGWWLGTLDSVIRLLTPSAEIERAVWQRAKAEFLDQKIGHTKRATGVLLFLSMTEHRAIVLADQAISAKFNQDSWQEVCNRLVAGLKGGDLKEGLVSAINLSGSMMTKHFPAVDGGSNQLPDRLVIRE